MQLRPLNLSGEQLWALVVLLFGFRALLSRFQTCWNIFNEGLEAGPVVKRVESVLISSLFFTKQKWLEHLGNRR